MKKELLAVLGCGILAIGLASCDTDEPIVDDFTEGEVILDYTENLGVIWYDSENILNGLTRLENHEEILHRHYYSDSDEVLWDFDECGSFMIFDHKLSPTSYTTFENEEEIFYAVKVTQCEKYKEVIGIKDKKHHYSGDTDFPTYIDRNVPFLEQTYLYYQPKETFEVKLSIYHLFEDYTYEYIKDATYTAQNLDYEKEIESLARAKVIFENIEDYMYFKPIETK